MGDTRQWQATGATGLTLHVEELRPDGGPAAAADGRPGDDAPLVLVHGIAGSVADWASVAPDLATTRRVVAYDQRGHGQSDPVADGPAGPPRLAELPLPAGSPGPAIRSPGPAGPPVLGGGVVPDGYSFDLLLADLVAVLDAIGSEPVHLVGHSMGGVIALRYTLDHPDRVRSLVLVDTAAAPASATGPVARRLVGALLDGAAALLSAHRPTPDSPTSAEPADPTALAHHAASPAQRAADGITRVDPEALRTLGRELDTYPSLVDRLTEIRAPTTVIVGEHDTGLRDAATTMAHAIPGAHLAVIANADHSPHASQPLAWLTAVDDHLARLPGNRRAQRQTPPRRDVATNPCYILDHDCRGRARGGPSGAAPPHQ